MNLKFEFVLIVFIFSIFLVSANGLYVNPPSFSVNKSFGVNKQIIFSIKNEEPFSFYNISFEDNSVIYMSKISELTSGNEVNVTATINTENNFNGNVKIKGFYIANIGPGNETYTIDVDFNEGLSRCDFSAVKGDSVTWINLVTDEIKLRNEDTKEYVTTILEGGSYTTHFSNPETFRYSFYRRGYRFTDICDITVLDDQGLINDPNLDAQLNLDIKLVYDPTNIEVVVLERNYSMDFFGSSEGVLTIKNIGSKTAKNVNLAGDWFSFNYNNFDINTGDTKVVTYTIEPNIYDTNSTNKTYEKNITISGNFDTRNELIDIFINYAEIGGDYNYTNGTSGFMALIEQYCNAHPEVCNPKPRIIYKNIDNSTPEEFNVTFEVSQVSDMFSYMFEIFDYIKTSMNYVKEGRTERDVQVNSTNSKVDNLESLIIEEKESREKNNTTVAWVAAIIIFIFVVVLLVLIIFQYKKINRLKKYDIT